MNEQAFLSKLDELLTVLRIAHRDRWLDYKGVAELIGHSAEYVRQKIVNEPDFPAPARPGGGHPRWLESEVHAWMQGQVRSN